MCSQNKLLALRRSVLPVTPIRSNRKADLIADIAAKCDTSAGRQRIFANVLAPWSVSELRLFIARSSCVGPVGQRLRKQDLIAAIVRAGECTATAPTVSTATAPTVSKRTRMDIRSSAGLAEQLGLHAEEYSDSEGPGSAVEPPSCTVLVALDSAVAPLKLQQKLTKRWRKKWAKLYKKKDRKQRLKRVEEELRKAMQEHWPANLKVKELRAIVGKAVGFPIMDKMYRVRFDKAIIKLVCAPPPKKRRARRRFTIAIARKSKTESA